MALPFSIALFMGPLLILVCIALVLFGIFSAQVYAYWMTYERDPPIFRGLVLVLWNAECLHSIFCIHMLYEYLIRGVGNPLDLENVIWSAGATFIAQVLIVSLAQGFSVLRIWQLSKGDIRATAIPAVLLTSRIVFGLVTASYLFAARTWPKFYSDAKSFATVSCGFALAAAVDCTTTALLTYYLRRQKKSFKRTNFPVQKLVFYTVNNGAVAMICSIVTVFLFGFLGTSLMFFGLVQVITKLYASSALALLNSRPRVKTEDEDAFVFNEIPLEIRGGSGSYPERPQESQPQTGMKVDIFNEVPLNARNSGMGKRPGGTFGPKSLFRVA